MTELIGPGEAARRLGVSPRTVQRWLRSGRLPSVRVGDRLKVPVAALSAAPGTPRGIERLLVANRGELVPRIARTCRRLGIRTVALVAEDESAAWWPSQADERVPLAGSYLDADAVLDAARRASADAIHPGYGFLAENPDFAAAVLRAGLTWVGPPPAAMRALGDKAAARRLAARVGVPILAGYDGEAQDDATFVVEAERIGFPVLVKPSAGGGGKGMHVVRAAEDLTEALRSARRESRTAFGDDRLVLERYLDRPRHVEVQLLLDAHGNGAHLGERDCSLQRRHQKVVEEAPAPGVDARLRARLGHAALRLARAAAYTGAGTAEFLLADDGTFAFLELNARLQVEHPVTEAVTGIDLVAAQLRVAAGGRLGINQRDVVLTGHALEARLYAEDPWTGFLPAAGEVLEVALPSDDGIRVDAGVGRGDVIGTRYDPLLAKIVAHGANRDEARRRLLSALEATQVLGVTTNAGFLRAALAWPEFASGDARTDLIDARWHPDPELPPDVWPAAASALAHALAPAEPRAGFRLNAAPSFRVRIGVAERTTPASPDRGYPWAIAGCDAVVLDVDGRAVRARLATAPTVESAVLHAARSDAESAAVVAPMPGVVLAVRVAEGDRVEAGAPLVVLEAMKMENAVPAPSPGTVHRVLVQPGAAVQRGDALVEMR